jgi:hypothetical protein
LTERSEDIDTMRLISAVLADRGERHVDEKAKLQALAERTTYSTRRVPDGPVV